jgi:hypothetical protein
MGTVVRCSNLEPNGIKGKTFEKTFSLVYRSSDTVERPKCFEARHLVKGLVLSGVVITLIVYCGFITLRYGLKLFYTLDPFY